jgi:hypothetical protein
MALNRVVAMTGVELPEETDRIHRPEGLGQSRDSFLSDLIERLGLQGGGRSITSTRFLMTYPGNPLDRVALLDPAAKVLTASSAY